MMPIKPENRHLYPGGSPTSGEWMALRARILARAGHRCERCKAPNRAVIACADNGETYMLATGAVHDADDGAFRGLARGSEYPVKTFVRIVLTIAHLDHDPRHNDDGNLAALCQRCHNRHDAPHRRRNAARTRRSRKAGGDLFEGPAGA